MICSAGYHFFGILPPFPSPVLTLNSNLPTGPIYEEQVSIEFVSLSEQVDTSTPTGKMVFTVMDDVAELERSLIVLPYPLMSNTGGGGQERGRFPRHSSCTTFHPCVPRGSILR